MDGELYAKLKKITEEEAEILRGRCGIDRARYMGPRAGVIDSAKLLGEGKLIQVRPHTRFVRFPKHTHNYVELIYMCSGETTHIVNGTSVVLKSGELLFLSQNAAQEILPAGENDVAVNFIILPEFFDRPLRMIGAEENLLRDFVVECLRDGGGAGYLHFRVSGVLPVQNLVENLIWSVWNGRQDRRSANQVTMGLLFLQLMDYTDRLDVGNGSPDRELTLSVLRYVEEHYRDGGLSVLASELKYDVYWLSRKIRQLTGRSYTELVQARRLGQAAFLLANTELPVSDVGAAAGYDNLSYFHRIFKEKYGVPPRRYRLQNKENGALP